MGKLMKIMFLKKTNFKKNMNVFVLLMLNSQEPIEKQ